MKSVVTVLVVFAVTIPMVKAQQVAPVAAESAGSTISTAKAHAGAAAFSN